MLLKKNKLIQATLVALVSSAFATSSFAAQKKDKLGLDEIKFENIAFGYQFNVDSHGLSARMDLSEKLSAQAILGVFGEVSNYTVRGRYHLATDQKWDAYAYVSAGLYTWEDDDFAGENVPAVGAGIGMEYDWQNLDSGFPPITWSFELDVNTADFDNYDYSNFSIGIGAHYRF